MGVESSDDKSRLVLEICSLSTLSISCVHKHGFDCGEGTSPFVDWYRILGVEESANADVFRKQYHKLALQLHPDKNNHPKSEVAFKLVLEAYSCLSNEISRRAFDAKRFQYFCVDCNEIPYRASNSVPDSCGFRFGVRQEVRDIRQRFREEAQVIEKCLKENGRWTRKESPVFNPSSSHCAAPAAPRSNVLHFRSKESPVFDPSNYRFNRYPHFRNRVLKNPEYMPSYRRGSARFESPVFGERTDRVMFNQNSSCVPS